MNESNGPSPLETLKGGAEIQVTHLDGSLESIHLRQVSIGQCEQLLLAQGNEPTLACFYSGRDRAWFDSLDPDSQERVVVEGDRINADFFARWYRRLAARQDRILPGAMEKFINRALEEPEAPPAPPAPAPSPSRISAPPPVRSRE
jgi:hypothetical protein